MLDRARELEGALANHADGGRLRVGATLTIGNYVAVPLMARFMRERPGSTRPLDVANTEEIARRVANFEIDVGLIEGELTHPHLRGDAVPRRRARGLLRRRRTRSRRSARSPTPTCSTASWIVREHGSGTRQAFDRAMSGILPELEIALELQHTEVIKRAVEAGLGLGCVSRLALVDAFRAGTLRPRPVPQRDFRRRFYTVVHRQKHVGTDLKRWLALLD